MQTRKMLAVGLRLDFHYHTTLQAHGSAKASLTWNASICCFVVLLTVRIEVESRLDAPV